MESKLITDRAALFVGDAAKVGEILAPNSIDAIVTDPPAGISFMGREWDGDKGGRDAWIEWLAGVMREALRVLKPGGHALVWALPRTSHWTATALEDAGFELRDVVMHLFGSGFPKSLNVSKVIDAAAGAERQVIGFSDRGVGNSDASIHKNEGFAASREKTFAITASATDAARAWEGWGTALKPAAEHWLLVRKPLEGTVAANVQQWGTGALNIDACRIGSETIRTSGHRSGSGNTYFSSYVTPRDWVGGERVGRWPANLTLDEAAAELLDAQSGVTVSRAGGRSGSNPNPMSWQEDNRARRRGGHSDRGGASRFFYVAKPSKAERNAGCEHLPTRITNTDAPPGSKGANSPGAGANRSGAAQNHHPTVKSIALMRWLCRLITPPGGAVLDLFAGSGSTGVAALAEGFEFVGIEREPDYAEVASARLQHALGQP